jgi:hypothetical protein
VKARTVKGLEPDGPLAGNGERIVRMRLDELCSFMPVAADPGEVRALHDMRIAAKRLRYVLELFASVFGPYAATGAKRAKELQDLLGEIHDCDVTIPRIEALVGELREHDAGEVSALAGDADDLDPGLVPSAPHVGAFRGLESMTVYLLARRSLLFARFLEFWTELERSGFRARLEYAASERAQPPEAMTSRSPDGNGAGSSRDLPSHPSPT